MTLYLVSGTGAGQSRVITAYTNASDTATVDTWTTTPDNTTTYIIYPTAPSSTSVPPASNVLQWNSTAVASPATAGIPDINVKNINNVAAATPGASGGVLIAGTNAATTITGSLTTTFTGNLTGSVASVTGAVGSVTGAVGSVSGAVGSVTGNVGGNVVGSVGSVAGAVGSVTGNVGGNVVGSVASVTAGVTLASSAGIKKNTAKAGFMFLMTDAVTHAPKTGLTVTSTRSLDGAAFGACTNSAAEVSNGWYKIDLAAGDLNGNTVALRFTALLADDCNVSIVTGG
jgi:hypothetical protein